MNSFTSLLIIVIVILLISGVFTLFDTALISCRKSRLEKERGKNYKAVLKLLEKPDDGQNIFFDKNNISRACRIWSIIFKTIAVFFAGITSSFILTSIFPAIYPQINQTGSRWLFILTLIGLALALCIITALLSEAFPKLISSTKPEAITAALLPLMKILSVPMTPFVKLTLKFASFFKITFHPEIDDANITEEELQDELRNTLLEGEKSGIVESKERSMVEGVFYLGDRPVGAFMTHRSEIEWLDINLSYNEIKEKVLKFRNQRYFPVVDGNQDEIAGAVYLEDIIIDMSQSTPRGLRAIMKKAQFVPETMTALKAFESFRHGQSDFLFVMDEYGGLAGIISIRALVEEIVGELSAPVIAKEPLTKQEDGFWLADGTLNIDDAVQALSLTGLPEDGDFHTLAGFILYLAGELPGIGDSYEYQEYRFTVKEMDGNRIDKILIHRTIIS